MKGWRPISVTYQPASVATQPENEPLFAGEPLPINY
jgi:hypothetical protein